MNRQIVHVLSSALQLSGFSVVYTRTHSLSLSTIFSLPRSLSLLEALLFHIFDSVDLNLISVFISFELYSLWVSGCLLPFRKHSQK